MNSALGVLLLSWAARAEYVLCDSDFQSAGSPGLPHAAPMPQISLVDCLRACGLSFIPCDTLSLIGCLCTRRWSPPCVACCIYKVTSGWHHPIMIPWMAFQRTCWGHSLSVCDTCAAHQPHPGAHVELCAMIAVCGQCLSAFADRQAVFQVPALIASLPCLMDSV